MRLVDDQVRNFFTAGLLRATDVAFAVGFGLACTTVLYWRLFGHPTADELIVVLLACIVCFQAWVVLLVLRIGVIVLGVRADINLMPAMAARLAVSSLTPSMAAPRPTATVQQRPSQG